MKADKTIAIYRRMRTQPLWRLLAANNAPTVIGLLQTHLYETERRLPASIFIERIARDLEELRAQGEDFPQTAQAYVSAWLGEGYLIRRFLPGATEEEYELSTPSIEAIRFVSNLIQPHSATTETRLALVIQALVQLAEDTDTDQKRRINRLIAERTRINKEIESIDKGKMRVLSHDAALERIREIICLADDLSGDFHRVRDQFEQLNRDLREKIVDNEGNRGDILNALFAGIDLISESESGKTFSAFWRLLTDPEQAAILDQALDNVLSREFATQLNAKDRRFLLRLMRNLLEQGGTVHEVLQTFARSLKHFVQSREYLEQRRLNQLLKDAQHAALTLKDEVTVTSNLQYSLELTSGHLQSFSQWTLYDPSLQAEPEQMKKGDLPSIDLHSVGMWVAQSEIDFRTLQANIDATLEECNQASIADVLDRFPANQGLGSVIGLLTLGCKHGIKSDTHETVAWIGDDNHHRSACIPKIFFLKGHINEFF